MGAQESDYGIVSVFNFSGPSYEVLADRISREQYDAIKYQLQPLVLFDGIFEGLEVLLPTYVQNESGQWIQQYDTNGKRLMDSFSYEGEQYDMTYDTDVGGYVVTNSSGAAVYQFIEDTTRDGWRFLVRDGQGNPLYSVPAGEDFSDEIVNSGTLDGDIYLGLGSDSVTNSGTITGDVYLQEGHDYFDSHASGGIAGRIDAGSGNDTIVGTSGSDRIDGGAGGADRVDYRWSTAGVDVNLAARTASGGYAQGDQLTRVEYLTGSDFADRLDGTAQANALAGRGGNDSIAGGAGNDTLDGDAGADKLFGDDGDDIVRGGDGHDIVAGGSGNDIMYASGNGNDTVRGDAGNDIIGGGDGNDLLIGDGTDASFFDTGSLGAAAGSDTIYGGTGNDTIVGTSWDDNGDGLAGITEIITSGADGRDVIWAGDGDDLAFGGGARDTLGGGVGSDEIHGFGGNDLIYGGKGAASVSADTLDGGAGADNIFGGAGNDSLTGDSGNDTLYGGDDNDVVDGGAGDDSIYGGVGDDTLAGGDGADRFSFGASHGSDVISDFSADDDILGLANTVTDFTSAADVQAAATATTVSGETGVLINTGGGDSVFLVGLTIGDLAGLNYGF
jgi:Ca2+-binding RTX toxin-like protein